MSTPAKVSSQIMRRENDLEARPNASRANSGTRRHLRSLLPEEKMTYRRWMYGAWIFYSAVVVVLGGLIFAGSSSTTIPALEKGAAHARLAAGSK